MNLDTTVESLAKRYRPETREWENSVKLVAKRFTRGQLTKKKKELEEVVLEITKLVGQAEVELMNPAVKESFDTAYRQLELVSAARKIHFQPLEKRWL